MAMNKKLVNSKPSTKGKSGPALPPLKPALPAKKALKGD